jgi:hypothetical protein
MEYSEECFFTHCSIGTLSKLSGGVKNGWERIGTQQGLQR